MSPHERSLTRELHHAQRLLSRLQREVRDRGRAAHPFARLCDMAAIPRDLRAALLDSLVLHGYVQPEGGDLVALTGAGARLASAPPPPGAPTDNPSPRDGASLARPPGSGMRG